MPPKDYYSILRVPRSASIDQIKKAYRSLALSLHPDMTGGDKLKEQLFKEVVEAFETLGNAALRAVYDGRYGIGSTRSSTYERHTNTSYRPQGRPEPNRPISSTEFNVAEWNAWHYGDGVQVTSNIKQTKTWMNQERSPHKAYYEKKAAEAFRIQQESLRRASEKREPSRRGDEDKDCCVS